MPELESIQINLCSKYASRIINDNNCNAIFNINNLIIPSEHHIHISVVNCIIPYSFYNINSSNNILMYILNGVLNTLTIPPGNYNINTLTTFLKTNMPGINCVYSSLTNKFTFSTSNINFSFSPISTCLSFMGFKYNFDSINYNLTSFNCVNLQTTQCIHIQSNFQTGNINSSNIYLQNTLCTIPINGIPNGTIIYENNGTVFTTNLYSNILNNIVIKIVDQNNTVIDLNGVDWSMTLQLDIVDFVN